MKNLLTILFAVLLTASAQAGAFPESVYKAHNAYLKGDGATLLKEIKSSLLQTQNHPIIVKNMAELYTAAAKNSLFNNVAPDWQMPKEITYSGFEIQRKLNLPQGRVGYSRAVFVGVEDGSSLEQLQVIRYPDEVIFDYVAKIGDWYVDHSKTDKETDYWAGGSNSSKPFAEGLYLLNIKIKGQVATQGWFVLANKNSSANPVVLSPSANQLFADGKPQFNWNQFQSPEYQAGERLRVGVKISQAGGEEEDIAGLTLADRQATSYKYGDKSVTEEFNGPDQLASGNYNFRLFCRETERFGEFMIRRTSSTKVPFSVK